MERLEPVLKQKFWILLGIGILMTIAGWWMATGTMAATITSRRTEIENAEKKVPSGEIPNNEWSASLGSVNGQQDQAVKSASRILWDRQRARMTWPETVAEFAWKNGYRGTIDVSGRENYRTDYENDWRRVWESVQPFNRIDGSGIVEFSQSKMPFTKWGDLAPSDAEMWDAQEDLWLLEAILQLIAEVNGGATATRLDACIHQIEQLKLLGGQPAGQRAVASTGATPAGNVGGSEMMGGAGFGLGGSGGGGSATAVSVEFDPKEELGDDGAGGGGQAAPVGAMPSGPGGLGGPGGTTAKAKRYIDDDKALPFRTRGFYMTLIMDHRKIPNLIAELSGSEKSAWPIEIVRVQYVRLHEDDTDGKGAGGGFNPGMSAPDQFGGGPAGPTGESGFGGPAAPGFSLENNAGGGVTTPQGQTALAALMNAMQDPNMARVTLCGIITLYNEVKPEESPAVPAGSQPVAPAPVAAAPRAEPADGAAPSTDAKVEADAKPTPSAEGEPAKPDDDAKSAPVPEAAPKKDETTPATPEAKPADTP